MEILKVDNLTKNYGKNNTFVKALKETNLTVNRGNFVAIVGASGSGKSTLLNLIGGLDTPTLGTVAIENNNIYSLSEKELSIFRRNNIGLIFQNYNLIPTLTAEENIILPLLFGNKNVDEVYLEDLLKFLKLEDRRNHYPNELSGGQQQRVAIARALINKPAIVIADEPTGNLDTDTSNEVLKLLNLSAQKYNQTLIMVTHDLEIASKADRIITLQDGLIVKEEVINDEKI